MTHVLLTFASTVGGPLAFLWLFFAGIDRASTILNAIERRRNRREHR